MKVYFLVFFLNFYAFLAYPAIFYDPVTIEKANICLNTRTDSAMQKMCNKYRLNINEYKNVFSEKYFDNLKIPNFILLTVPKKGTELTSKVIALMIGRLALDDSLNKKDLNAWKKQLGEYLNGFPFCHITNSNFQVIQNYNFCIENDFKVITTKRDIRDWLISLIAAQRIIDNRKGEIINWSIQETLKQQLLNRYSAINLLGNFYLEMKRIASLGLEIKFEDLLGEKGGGSLSIQKLTILNIANYLNITLNNQQLNYICENLWGISGTFRKGIIGDWKNYFTDDIKETFIKLGGADILIAEGYEKDYDW